MWINWFTFTIHTSITNAPHLSLLCVRLKCNITFRLCDEHGVLCASCHIINYQILISECFYFDELNLRYGILLFMSFLLITLDWYAKLASLVVTHNSQFTTCEQHHSVSLTYSHSLNDSGGRFQQLRYLHSHKKLPDWSKSNEPDIHFEIFLEFSLLSHLV